MVSQVSSGRLETDARQNRSYSFREGLFQTFENLPREAGQVMIISDQTLWLQLMDQGIDLRQMPVHLRFTCLS